MLEVVDALNRAGRTQSLLLSGETKPTTGTLRE